MTEVTAGWVIVDQAAVIGGMSFGPNWLKGRQRSGPLTRGFKHNLIGKDIVFRGKGKHAFGEIIALMGTMDDVLVRCGIYEGMVQEKFVASEYGGGDDQITFVTEKEDIVRVDYYAYAFKPDKTYTFTSLVTNFGLRLTGFIPGSGLGGMAREFIEALGTLFEYGSKFRKTNAFIDLITADEVVVVLTAKKSQTRGALVEHKHTHRLSTLAKEIADIVNAG
ncbi:hypothetical protein EDF56_10769 [Novosphingobium sp. PhB165]|uniref:hypothetical protein n=1 Tax=Novosphingobium sp. PhB165 TaxID=2485105 RepID=UPI0010429ECC|nr:hypothetical protein [Novosphingobium sp. PhB165]TCM16490.1 hypothetical protein EDF56_10769 [Novosphingobium sp. PhB165]